MTRFGWMVLGGCIVVALLIGGLAMVLHARNTKTSVQAVSTSSTDAERSTPVTDPSALSIYTNGEYGFSFFYPADGIVTDNFSSTTQTLVEDSWRAESSVKGTPIVQVQTSQGALTFGESTDAHERAVCLKAGPAEAKQASVTVGSTTWQHFVFEKVGTDNPEHITSYRIVKDTACMAFEVREPRSATASSTDYAIEKSISSFSFAH
jgi:hypothetical protein